jgi:hypothetical protein
MDTAIPNKQLGADDLAVDSLHHASVQAKGPSYKMGGSLTGYFKSSRQKLGHSSGAINPTRHFGDVRMGEV